MVNFRENEALMKFIALGGIVCVYGVLSLVLLHFKNIKGRALVFALINIIALRFLFYGPFLNLNERFHSDFDVFYLYLGVVFLQYILVFYLSNRRSRFSWMPMVFPVLLLCSIKAIQPFEAYIGISYMAFRLSHLALEVRNERTPKPGFGEFFSFAFFVPTIFVGPISPYTLFHRSFHQPDRKQMPIFRSLERILIGALKYRFLASLCLPLTFGSLWNDDHMHGVMDFFISCIASYLFIYCNFSGSCDIAIGIAGLMGIEVKENFENPFSARNCQEFWNKWHITLSHYMRDLVFTPFSTLLARFTGGKYLNHLIALSILVVFLLIGLWHGVTINFILFGLWHGIGVLIVHYYGIQLKKRLGQKYKTYLQNQYILRICQVCTFCYVSLSFFFFMNNKAQMIRVFRHLAL